MIVGVFYLFIYYLFIYIFLNHSILAASSWCPGESPPCTSSPITSLMRHGGLTTAVCRCHYCDVPPCQWPDLLLRNAGKLARMGIPSGDMAQPPVVATAMIRFSLRPRAEPTTGDHVIPQGQVIIYTYLPSSLFIHVVITSLLL